ncbi:MAG: hypothetical protein JKY92_00530 [Magnetovibrio sp.]|nr:hypothetical protein [Magnetovibrio sp.]
MTVDVSLGRKFNANHQLAIILTRHLGVLGARKTANKNGWKGVLAALEEQDTIITLPV